jgi:hypothetical protein
MRWWSIFGFNITNEEIINCLLKMRYGATVSE